jgi:hypothetical protein
MVKQPRWRVLAAAEAKQGQTLLLQLLQRERLQREWQQPRRGNASGQQHLQTAGSHWGQHARSGASSGQGHWQQLSSSLQWQARQQQWALEWVVKVGYVLRDNSTRCSSSCSTHRQQHVPQQQ